MTKLYTDKSGSWYGGSSSLNEKQQKFNAQCVLKYCKQLSDKVWSNNSICAVLGNMSFESTINPMLNEYGGSGYGLVQWTPKSNLQKRAKSIGQYDTYDTMYTQMCVIDYESEKNLQWIKTTEYPLSFNEFIKSNESLLYLTGAWLKNYERPADQSESNILKRYNGDLLGHIGSKEWNDILDFNLVDDDVSITGFLKWCETIANNNSYQYKLGAGHGVPWNYSGKYFDCSSFVSFALHNGGGFDLDTQFTTANQKNELEQLGFSVKKFNKSDLKKGDIIFYNINGSGHTEVVYSVDNSNILLVGAHNDTLPPNEQISIIPFYNSDWQYYARSDTNNPPLPEPITPIKLRYNQRFCPFVFPRMR